MRIFFRKQKETPHETMMNAIEKFEKSIKAPVKFGIYCIMDEKRFNEDIFNYKQIQYSDFVIDILDNKTINFIKSRFSDRGIFTKERFTNTKI